MTLRSKLWQTAPVSAHLLKLLQAEWRAAQARPLATPHGFSLRGSVHQAGPTFEPDELAFIRSELQHCYAFVDIGANLGLYTCLARVAGRPVVAVEPHPQNLQFLFANLSENGFDDVTVYPTALAAKPGMLTLFGSGSGASLVAGWAGAVQQTRVAVLTLDSILLGAGLTEERLLIKIDVEGAEDVVLSGASRTLQQEPAPVWMVENDLGTHHPSGRNPAFEAVFDTFFRSGYRATSIDTGREVTRADVSAWLDQGRVTFGGHNYAFTRDSRGGD